MKHELKRKYDGKITMQSQIKAAQEEVATWPESVKEVTNIDFFPNADKADVSGEPVAWKLCHRLYNDLKDAEWDWRHDDTFSNTGYAPEPLYTSPPQSQALVAAAYRVAAGVCMKQYSGYEELANSKFVTETGKEIHNAMAMGALNCSMEIRGLTPADAEQALRDMMIRAALDVRNEQSKLFTRLITNEQLEDIVDKVIKGE